MGSQVTEEEWRLRLFQFTWDEHDDRYARFLKWLRENGLVADELPEKGNKILKSGNKTCKDNRL